MLRYGLILRNMNHMSTYKTILCIINPYIGIWTICRHTKQCCTLYIRAWTYELILRNTNYMSTYETILYIINPYVDIWTHFAQCKPYVDTWNNIPLYEVYIKIWNNTAHYTSICSHTDLYCAIWLCALQIHMSTNETILQQHKPYVDIWNYIAQCKFINRHMDL